MTKKWIKPETRTTTRGYLEIVTPRFSSYEGEADWWDHVDTSELLEKGEPVELLLTQSDDRCDGCGNRMRLRSVNVNLMDGRIVVRKVQQYRCPRCGRTKLSRQGAAEIEEIVTALQGEVAALAAS